MFRPEISRSRFPKWKRDDAGHDEVIPDTCLYIDNELFRNTQEEQFICHPFIKRAKGWGTRPDAAQVACMPFAVRGESHHDQPDRGQRAHPIRLQSVPWATWRWQKDRALHQEADHFFPGRSSRCYFLYPSRHDKAQRCIKRRERSYHRHFE